MPSGFVVFLVALPLCLGIALASGAGLFAGLITGIVGGVVVSLFSRSQLSVSGPAAGLTVIVLNAIETLGSYQAFLLAVIIAGALQIILGFVKAGTIANYFPSCVIKGMLAAIGIILILKQIPHVFGYDADYNGDFTFIQMNAENSFSAIANMINKTHAGAIIIGLVSLLILIIWERPFFKKLRLLPVSLVVVIVGIVLNELFAATGSMLSLRDAHLVNIPSLSNAADFKTAFVRPDFSQWQNPGVYLTAVTLAIVASLESLLSIEAIDQLDPLKRVSPANHELKTQGIGNIVSGFLGGLPMTAVIVRGSANVSSGAKTKASSFFHGIFLLAAVLLFPSFINKIPLAALAALLLMVGYKLAKVSLFKAIYKMGWDQFVPFMVTIAAIVLTDLLKGIAVGMAVGIFYILRRNLRNPYYFHRDEYDPAKPIRIELAQEVSFLNKSSILYTLDEIPENSRVIIDGSNSGFIDYDVLEIIDNFRENAVHKDITVELINIKPVYKIAHH
jgi:MFS superfamily sulfate permease-like transporter